MCATQMNTSDNPGLWDIQFNSWLFCEFNATVKSLFSCITHGVREGGFDLTFGTHGNFGSRFPVTIHALATNGDSAGFSCDRPRTHAIAITSDSLTAGQGFSIAKVSHTRKHETGHTHIHSVTSCDDERRIRLPGYFSKSQSFQRFTLTSEAS